MRPSQNSVYMCHNPEGIKHLIRLRLCFSHLREHKFKHGFLDTLNPFCDCGYDIESTNHFLLHCPNLSTERNTFLSKIKNIDNNILQQNDNSICKTLLFGNPAYNDLTNTNILNATIDYILTSKRFDESLF